MTPIQIFITLGGIALSLFIAWFFWLAPKVRPESQPGQVVSRKWPLP